MKRLMLVPAVLLTVAAVPVAVAAPAHAKGATDVVVSGPGIDAVKLGYTRRTDDVDVGSLAEASGIYLIYGAAIATDDPGLTRAELGPRYELTWYQGSSVMAVSHVYPFTSQGAWMNIPDEHGGWVRGGLELERAMVTLGAERPGEEDEETGVSTSSTGVGSASSGEVGTSSPTGVEPVETSSRVLVAGVVGGASLAMLVGSVIWLARRRAGTLAAWPLHRST